MSRVKRVSRFIYGLFWLAAGANHFFNTRSTWVSCRRICRGIWRSSTSVVSSKSGWVCFCCFSGGPCWGMGVDRLAHRHISGQYPHGSAPWALYRRIANGTLAPPSTSIRAHRLGLLVHSDAKGHAHAIGSAIGRRHFEDRKSHHG